MNMMNGDKEDIDSFYADLKATATVVVNTNQRERDEEPVTFLNSLYN